MFAYWNCEPKGASSSRFGIDRNLTAVSLNDSTADCQPDPGSWVLLGVVQAVEDFKNLLAVLSRDADTIVTDRTIPVVTVSLS